MKNSEITLRNAIERINDFAPIKIIFNGIVLYNDYDSDIETRNGMRGETESPLYVVPNRIWCFDKYIVTSINIEIVDFHHSIVSMQGEYESGL